jgi:hypothetical protein
VTQPSFRFQLLALLLLASSGVGASAEEPRPVQLFVLAGQSNMEGKGAVNTLASLADDPAHASLLEAIRGPDGRFLVRDDVDVIFGDRRGELTVGFGSRAGAHGPSIGPELGFGVVLGDALAPRVLLLKVAFGGKDIARDFLPPSAGGPGPCYQRLVSETAKVLADPKDRMPAYRGEGIELAGLVWFQGWNDMIDVEKTARYRARLAQLMSDFRRRFSRPGLPVVVGVMGVGGDRPGRGVARFQAAQRSLLTSEPELAALKLVETAPFYDRAAHRMFQQGVWRGTEKQRFYRVASDRPYHYLGSGPTFYLIGRAFGEAMLGLRVEER